MVSPGTVETPPDETAEVNELETIVFTEEEINSLLSQVATMIAEAGLPVKLNYATARLAEDKMFVSVSAEAKDMNLEAENIEVLFQGTEMLASGKASTGNINFSVKVRISLSGGKLIVDIEDIKPRLAAIIIPQLSEKNREKLNQYLNQKLAEIPFSLPLQELDEITIEDSKLIIKGK